jgi:hypothetical protein
LNRNKKYEWVLNARGSIVRLASFRIQCILQ